MEAMSVVYLQYRTCPGEEEVRSSLWYRAPGVVEEWREHDAIALMLSTDRGLAETWAEAWFRGRVIQWVAA